MAMIVVGVDGSEESKEALRWAHEEALLREASVRAVCAWHDPYLVTPGFGPPQDFAPDALRERAVELLDAIIADVASYSEVHVDATVAEGRAASVLVDAADGADLLVVGSRGHGGFVGLLLGSVSQQCVTHAPCPVLVVRGRTG